ncbi:MAG: queuosine precursor transporter [Magnetococcales bacterium]|nr:queuosine precursor transporter [Magnetococcales bacterium]
MSPFWRKSTMSVTNNFKFLGLFMALNIAFQLISDATAGKIILLFGVGVSVTVFYFPFTYIISDVLTEVYGYAKARTVLWYTLIASILAGIFYQIAVAIPAAPFFEHSGAYDTVFGIVPRILIGGWLAVFSGDICNNYVMAKLKIKTNGRFLWVRTILSTVVGQGVNTAVFYTVALAGILPNNLLIEGILAGWILKTIVEALMTPVTYFVVHQLKNIEGIDHFDKETNFNPFIFLEEKQSVK